MPDDAPQDRRPRPIDAAPELHNSEQDDPDQAQDVAEDARALTPATRSPTESGKPGGPPGAPGGSEQDVVDRMRDMESSGRIDMDAYRGEPNMDDDEGKYGRANKPDDGPGDGAPGRGGRR